MTPLELFRAPHFEDPQTSRAAAVLAPLLTIISVAVALTTVSSLTIAWAQNWQVAATLIATGVLVWARWMVQIGRVQIAAGVTTTILFTMSISSLLADQTPAMFPCAFAMAIAIGGITMRRPGPLWLGAFSALCIVLTDFGYRWEFIVLDRPLEEPAVTIIQAVAFVALGATIHWANRALDRARARAAEQESRAASLQQSLVHAQRMEAIGRLAGGIAHDFNNVLTVVSGSATVLAHAVEFSDDDQASCEAIIKAADSGAKLTRQLLAFGGKQVVRPEVLDVAEALTDFRPVLDQMCRQDEVSLVISAAPGMGFVEIDPGQLQQAVANLVVNASHASPPGSRVDIDVEAHTVPAESPLSHGTLVPGQYLVVRIRDDGRGMDEETVSAALDPFFTTRRGRGGTGLGLAVVHGVAKQAGGQVDIQSEAGGGTTVSLWLPSHDGPATWRPSAPPSRRAVLQGQTVLLVDDDDAVRTAIRRQLESAGAKIHETATGSEALELAKQHPRISAAIVDVSMPGMTGPEVLERLKESAFSGTMTLLTGYAEPDQLAAGVLANTPIIYKPATTPQLVAAVLGRSTQPAADKKSKKGSASVSP